MYSIPSQVTWSPNYTQILLQSESDQRLSDQRLEVVCEFLPQVMSGELLSTDETSNQLKWLCQPRTGDLKILATSMNIAMITNCSLVTFPDKPILKCEYPQYNNP